MPRPGLEEGERLRTKREAGSSGSPGDRPTSRKKPREGRLAPELFERATGGAPGVRRSERERPEKKFLARRAESIRGPGSYRGSTLIDVGLEQLRRRREPAWRGVSRFRGGARLARARRAWCAAPWPRIERMRSDFRARIRRSAALKRLKGERSASVAAFAARQSR